MSENISFFLPNENDDTTSLDYIKSYNNEKNKKKERRKTIFRSIATYKI